MYRNGLSHCTLMKFAPGVGKEKLSDTIKPFSVARTVMILASME